MIDMQGFSNLKSNAINELLEMSKRASKSDNPPPQSSVKAAKISPQKSNVFNHSDETLILGLVLLLSKDCKDNLLLLALLYILM